MDPLLFLTTQCLDSGSGVSIPSNGLQVWLDASDTSTVTTVTGVSQWVDKSGAGNTVVQATEANQPQYVANVQAGKHIIRFDTSSWWLTKTSPVNLVGQAEMTIFVVSTTAGTSSLRQLMGCWLATGNQLSWRLHKTADQAGRAFLISTAGNATSLTVNVNAGVINTFYVTTVVVSTNTDVNHAGTDATGVTPGTPFASTAAFNIGSQEASTALWNGDIGEILIYNRQLAVGEIAQVQAYLNAKWGL